MALSIGELVGYVKLDTSGVAKGAAVVRGEMRAVGTSMDGATASGKRMGGGLSSGIKSMGMALGGLGLAKVAGDSISLEASFSKSMSQMQAATGATGGQMDKLQKLAMKMGADTSFSANDAAGAMLELAKAGVSTADVMGGGLKGTLTLAAAGGTDLGTAATIASNAMNAFALKGKDMGSIAAALAGGANASSASVESLGQGLAQVGPGARNAGLSLQETIGTLAAFDSAGIKGSDAGTSLKTMLASLIPQSKRAAMAMEDVGLFSKKTGSAFVKTNGQFKSVSQIAGLLHDKLGHLSEAQRSQALTSIFGSDASRAATVLMNQGTKGLAKFIKATKDQGAATKMANSNMSGTSGALERMRGSIETAELAIGQALAPAVQSAAAGVGKLAGGLATMVGWLSRNKPVAIGLGVAIGTLTALMLAFNTAMEVQAAGGLAKFLLQTKLISSVTKVWTAVQWALNAALSANPIGLAVIGLVALGAALYLAWARSATFRKIVTAAFSAVRNVAGSVLDWLGKAVGKTIDFVRAHWRLIVGVLGGPLVAAVILVTKHWNRIKAVTSGVWNGIKAVVSAAARAVMSYVGFWASLPGKVAGWFGKLKEAAADKLRSLVSFVGSIPGKILAGLGNLGGLLAGAGRAIMQGLIDGITSKISALTGVLHHITSLFPKKKGPIDKDRKLLKPAGVAIMEGLLKGLKSKEAALRDKLSAITDQFNATKDAATSFGGGITSAFQSDVFGGDLAGFDAGVASDTANSKAFDVALKAAAKKGLDGALFQQLAGSANLALAQQFAAMSKADIAQREKAFGGRTTATAAVGAYAADRVYGTKLDAQTKELRGVRADLQQVLKQERKVEAHVHHSKADAKELAARLHFKLRTRG